MVVWKFTFAVNWVAAAVCIAAYAFGVDTARMWVLVISSILSAVKIEASSSESGTAGGSGTKRTIKGDMEHVVDNVAHPYTNPRAATPGNLIIGGRPRRATI
ncbi:hypothetical protein V1515DRAFT_430815 [Lipomyces mesembrius]